MANVLITGTSGGFGKLTVDALIGKGHTVVASMRGIDGKNKAQADAYRAQGVSVVEIDVTNDESVDSGVRQAQELVGGLDVVVNNAGVGVVGVQETFTAEDWQTLFNVNVFGVQRVNRAVLPYMRKTGKGLLVHVSSILGRVTMPFYGPYNASKWALEAMVENYRTELSGFGVDAVIVEPGGYATDFFANLIAPSDTKRVEQFSEMNAQSESFLKGFAEALASNPNQKPEQVADAIVNLIETPAGQRAFRTVVDNMGMGDAVRPYNDAHEKVTSGLYEAFGMGQMLKLKTD